MDRQCMERDGFRHCGQGKVSKADQRIQPGGAPQIEAPGQDSSPSRKTPVIRDRRNLTTGKAEGYRDSMGGSEVR